MEPSQGDEFSFPVTKTPEIEKKLMEMPKRILDLEVSLYETIKLRKTHFTAAGKVRCKAFEKAGYNSFDEGTIKIANEKLAADEVYQATVETCNDLNEEIAFINISLNYLKNYFKALQSISRMV